MLLLKKLLHFRNLSEKAENKMLHTGVFIFCIDKQHYYKQKIVLQLQLHLWKMKAKLAKKTKIEACCRTIFRPVRSTLTFVTRGKNICFHGQSC